MSKNNPQYPVYVISKGRYENCLTANFLVKDKVPFKLVVEPQEKDEYVQRYGIDRVLILPFTNLGMGSTPARNWVWEHSKKKGHERHWILDDNIRLVRRTYGNRRLPCNAGIAFKVAEDFTNRYENIAISGLNYTFFVVPGGTKLPPFYLNNHVYSFLLIRNDLSYRWRGRYNEDTDLCLQVLSGGLCTVLINAFTCDKQATMTMKGGNSDVLYKGDGRLKMARSLQRMWPGVVETKRRFGRPQHVIKSAWRRFDTPLKLKPGIDLTKMDPNEYGMKLNQVKPIIKSDRLKQILK